MGCNNIRFDSIKWKNWVEQESNMHMRWDMVDDLMANHLQRGMKIHEVDALLGKSTTRNYQGQLFYYYHLGPCRWGINHGTLELRFEEGSLIAFEKRCN